MSQTEMACFIVCGIMTFIGIPLFAIIIFADVQYLLGNSDSFMAISDICIAAGVIGYICLLILGLGVYLDG